MHRLISNYSFACTSLNSEWLFVQGDLPTPLNFWDSKGIYAAPVDDQSLSYLNTLKVESQSGFEAFSKVVTA